MKSRTNSALVRTRPRRFRICRSHWVIACIATFFFATQAEKNLLGNEDIFFPGLLDDGDIDLLDGVVVPRKPPEKPDGKNAADPAGSQILELTDGSQIHGKLVSFGRAEVVWERADASGPLVFNPDEVRRFVLKTGAPIEMKKAGATLKLDGSDWLAGDLLEMKDGKFQLKIAPDSRVEIDRSKVEWIALSPAGPSPDAYEGPIGPMGLAGWDAETGPSQSWDYADGALVAKAAAPVGRVFNALPERTDLEFTAGDGGSPNRGFTLWIRPGSGVPRGYTKGAYYLRFQASTVSANFYTGEEIKNFSANLPSEKDEKKLTRYRLLMDRRDGRLIIHVNGKEVADWDLPATKDSPPEASLSWQPTYITATMAWTLSNVRVRPWDGDSAPDARDNEGKKDLLKAGSAARQAGVLASIDASAVAFGGAEISRKEEIFIRLAQQRVPEPPPGAVARVRLASRGEFEVTAIGFKDGELRLRTAFSGELTLPGDAIRAIEFPHRPAVTNKDGVDNRDRIVFRNGDELRGSFVAGGHDKPLQWKPPNSDKTVNFTQSNVAGVLLGSRTKGDRKNPPQPSSSAAVRLGNGDWLPGDLISLDAETLLLKSPISSELKIARKSVTTLYVGHEGEAPVWDGASDADDWARGTNIPGFSRQNSTRRGTATSDPWRYLDGAFTLVASGAGRVSHAGPGLGRTLKSLPSRVDVGFDLSTQGGQASYSIQLFFADNKQGFMIQGGGDSAYLYDMSPRQQGGVFFNQPQQIDFSDKVGNAGDTRRFRFLADRNTGRMWMYVNGALVGSMGRRSPANADNPKPGTGIAIIPRPVQSRVTISNIWIAPWSGTLPGAPANESDNETAGKKAEGDDVAKEETPPGRKVPGAKPGNDPDPQAPPQDGVALVNGDETMGTVLGATRDILTLRCDVGEIEVPLKRTTLVEFAGNPSSQPPGVRFRFAEKGALTVESFTVENGTVICRSAAVGEMKFPLAAVREIVWATDAARAFNAIPADDVGNDKAGMGGPKRKRIRGLGR